MEAINFAKVTSIVNSYPSFPSKNLSFLTPNYPLIAKTLNPPRFLLALCTSNSHTDTHNDNTVGENPNVEFSINPNKTDPEIKKNSSSTPLTPLLSRGLIFDVGHTGSWDSFEIGSPVVKRFLSDDEERWYMWYYGRSKKNPDTTGTNSIGLVVSSNGIHWERGEQAVDSSSGVGKVMNCSEDWWAFDTKSIRPSETMIMSSNKVRVSSGVYWLYYTGLSSEELELKLEMELTEASNGTMFKSLPGLAISQDGRNWARIEGDHHSGALFDVGSKGEWDSLFISSPHVVFHSNGDLRMYYHSFDPNEQKYRIGIARSRDGIKWVKLGKIKSIGQGSSRSEGEMGVLNACVVRDKKVGNYLMAYESLERDGMRSIGMAVSEDGLKDWTAVSNKPVLIASLEDGWDCKGVGSPCLVQMDGEEDQWRMYYTGFGVQGITGIGLAVSQDIIRFRRWEGFTYLIN